MDVKLPQKDHVMSKSRDIADDILRYGRKSLPHIARFCLVSTYIDDGLRMWFDWTPQAQYMNYTWNCGWFLATLFVIVNLIGQLSASVLVLSQKHATIACGMLFSITGLQIVAYNTLWELKFFMRNLAVAGGVVLLLADSWSEGRQLFAGLPVGEDKSRKPYMLLSGRVLLVLMFLTLLDFNMDLFSLLTDLIGVALVVLIALGFKTKVASLILAAWLTLSNLYINAWWLSAHASRRDYLRYDFFQTMSVIGGLLLVSSVGPGGISVDKHLKQW